MWLSSSLHAWNTDSTPSIALHLWGWRDSTVRKTLGLHTTDLDLFPQTLPRVIPKHRTRRKPEHSQVWPKASKTKWSWTLWIGVRLCADQFVRSWLVGWVRPSSDLKLLPVWCLGVAAASGAPSGTGDRNWAIRMQSIYTALWAISLAWKIALEHF